MGYIFKVQGEETKKPKETKSTAKKSCSKCHHKEKEENH
jgi:cytochrome c553